MSKILLGVIGVLVFICSVLYWQNSRLSALNDAFDIFKRHNLTKLAKAKPGLIETRANKGTKDVFDSIEKDTVGIDGLDDGLQLQPDTK